MHQARTCPRWAYQTGAGQNMAHGWSHGPVGATVAAWPAASLVGSYELLLWLIRTAASGALATGPAADQRLGACWTAGPGRSEPGRAYQVSGNGAVGWSMVTGADAIGEDREED